MSTCLRHASHVHLLRNDNEATYVYSFITSAKLYHRKSDMAVKFYFLLLLFFWLHSTKANADTKPNILFIVMDDLGWNDTSYQGSEIPTPTIDRFAQQGIRLQQYYVQRLCSPTRAAILSGRYPYYLQLERNVITNGQPFGMPLNQTTIANELKKGGYATHYVGKWGVGMHTWEYTPTYRGFDSFYGFYNNAEDYYLHAVPAAPNDRPTYEDGDDGDFNDAELGLDICLNPLYLGIDFRNNTDPVKDQTCVYSTGLFTESIMQAINKYAIEEVPFFIYAAYQAVRGPLEVPLRYLDECSFIPYRKRRIFCGMLRAVDEGITLITEQLQQKNLLDNTIIIFTTDNGGQTQSGSSNWPLRAGKDTVFEGGVRGTAFVWGSNLPKLNYDNNQLIHVTDWLPTIVEGIAGLELDEAKWKLDGYNVWDTITDDVESPRKEILLGLNPARSDFIGQAAIRSGDWKLVIGRPNCTFEMDNSLFACPDGWIHVDGTIEPPPYTPSLTWLFNITADPNERNNVADQYPDKVDELRERIEYYNSTHIEQLDPPLDPNSNPCYFGGVWTPWLD